MMNLYSLRDTSAWMLLVLLASCHSPCVLVAGEDLKREESNFLRAMAEGYNANRETFTSFSCRFIVTSGTARSTEQALKGVIENAERAEALWIVAQDKTRFEIILTTPPKLTRLEGPGNLSTSALPSEKFIGDAIRQLRFSPIMNGANVHTQDNPSPGIVLTPFDMGIMGMNERGSPAKLIHGSLNGKGSCAISGNEDLNGMSVPIITVSIPPGNSYAYTLDPRKGYLPVRVTGSDSGRLVYKLFITDAQECSGGRWFPTRSVWINHPQDAHTPLKVREIRVMELDADRSPKDDVFFIDLPKEAMINYGFLVGAQYRLETASRVGLRDIKALADRCREARERRIQDGTIQPESSKTSSLRAYVVTGLFLGSLTMIGLVVRAYRRQAYESTYSRTSVP